ncbi:MAG: InlB B-repeat-containing protein, partial [Clostridia bacterium]|nr:InlB B-repeat-containing protein [Clostridia bacterium]
MSKNKFFKKLLVAGLCALTATATVGTVVTTSGCKKDDDKQEQTQKYTVTYDLDGGTWSNANSVEVEAGATVTQPSNPTKTGYTFVKWVDAADNTDYDFNAKVESDLTLKAIWTEAGSATQYTVTWNLDGGTWSGAALPTTVQAGGKVNKVSGPSKTGYDFICWVGADGKEYDFNTAVNANLTLKAKFEKHVYTVTFKYDDNVFDIQHISYKDTANTIATDPAKPGKIFGGWLGADGKAYDFNTEITADTVVTASWTDKVY